MSEVLRTPVAIDLFAGCGGFSTGLLDVGYRVVAGFDNDRRSIETFDYNHAYRGGRGHVLDLVGATGTEILAMAGVDKVDLIVGGPPCQPFSLAGKQRGLDDKRGNLVFEFVRLVGEMRPAATVFENVANLDAIDNGAVAEKVREDLRALGYTVRTAILHAADYGVPQMRKRLFIVGVKEGAAVLEFPPAPTHAPSASTGLFEEMKPYVTTREALDDLPDVDTPAGREIHNHEPTLHTPAILEAFAALAPGRRDKRTFHDRLHPDRIGYTLRAGTGNFSPLRPIHYQYDRVISVRESARLQGFTDEFIWPDWVPRLQQYRQVGNAVAPPVAARVGETIANAMGWKLDPEAVRGDANSRPSPLRYTYEERVAARRSRMRGRSLGASASLGA